MDIYIQRDGGYYYHSDHLGSSSLITDLDGNVAQQIEYVPFGEVFIEEKNSTWNTPYKFNGKELDEETGLYYYGARYMDPRTSVWISVDPLAEKYLNTSSYVYCANNPIMYIDPDGRKLFPWAKYRLWESKEYKSVIGGFRSPAALVQFKGLYAQQQKTSSIFRSVTSQLSKSKSEYKVYQNLDYSTEDAGNYSTLRGIELYKDNWSGSVFEEFFHAGQHNFYGKSFENRSEFLREFEVKIAKMYSAVKEGNADILDGDAVLKGMSKTDINIIANSISGGKIDSKEFNKALSNLKEGISNEYKLKVDKSLNLNKSLQYLKKLIDK